MGVCVCVTLLPNSQAQYSFIHDALDELITCGETDIPAGALRTKVNLLSKVIPGKGITGFTNQFQVTMATSFDVRRQHVVVYTAYAI